MKFDESNHKNLMNDITKYIERKELVGKGLRINYVPLVNYAFHCHSFVLHGTYASLA